MRNKEHLAVLINLMNGLSVAVLLQRRIDDTYELVIRGDLTTDEVLERLAIISSTRELVDYYLCRCVHAIYILAGHLYVTDRHRTTKAVMVDFVSGGKLNYVRDNAFSDLLDQCPAIMMGLPEAHLGIWRLFECPHPKWRGRCRAIERILGFMKWRFGATRIRSQMFDNADLPEPLNQVYKETGGMLVEMITQMSPSASE